MKKNNNKHLKVIKNFRYRFRKSFNRKHFRKPHVAKTENNKKRRYRKNRTINTTIVVLPEILSLDSKYRSEFIDKINQIKRYLPISHYRCHIDHSKIKQIDPEALLILAAELKRVTQLNKNKNLKFNRKYAPKDDQVNRMLNSVGYWEHFKIDDHDHVADKKRRYLKIIHDTRANNLHVVDLRDFFQKQTDIQLLEDDASDVFDNAITEAIANSVEHAYIHNNTILSLKGAWWLCGSYDIQKNELFFGCYDQGVGFRNSLQHNDDRKLKKWFESVINTLFKRDSDIIEFVVENDLSKYSNKDRGYGLKEFIKFINNYSYGSLEIYSNTGECKFIKEKNSKITRKNDYSSSLNGTLIAWKIKVEGEQNDEL